MTAVRWIFCSWFHLNEGLGCYLEFFAYRPRWRRRFSGIYDVEISCGSSNKSVITVTAANASIPSFSSPSIRCLEMRTINIAIMMTECDNNPLLVNV